MQNDGNEKKKGGQCRRLLMALGIACDTSGTPLAIHEIFCVTRLLFIPTSIG